MLQPWKPLEDTLLRYWQDLPSPPVGDGCARASEAGKCQRAIWYRVHGKPETNRVDLRGHLSMRIGTLLGIDLAAAFGDSKYAAEAEASWRLGNVTGHTDLLYYASEEGPIGVVEFKTTNPRAWAYLDAPKTEHVLQLQLNAYGLIESGYAPVFEAPPILQLIYLNVAPTDDIVMGWTVPYDRARAAAEHQRLELIAGAGVLVDADFDPIYGNDWQCRYCRWRDQCVADTDLERDGRDVTPAF